LVGLSVIFFGAAITLNVFGYIRFDNDQCGSSLWLNVAVSAVMLLLPMVQVLQLNPQNNLLTTSLVSLLIAYFSYSAQLSAGNCTTRLTPLSYLLDVSANLFLFVFATYGTISGGLNE
jgi:hypothetical protein